MSNITRRNILRATASAGASIGLGPTFAAHAGTEQHNARAETVLDKSNIALITTSSAAEIIGRDHAKRRARLKEALRQYGFGVDEIRGKYSFPTYFGTHVADVRAFLVWGNIEDSGNLKGYVRKLGREYGQSAVIVKGYYRPAILHALRDEPGLGLKDRDTQDLGAFRPECLGAYVAFLAGLCAEPLAIKSLSPDITRIDPNGGRWLEIAAYSLPTMFNSGSKLSFSEDGKVIVAPYGKPRGYGPCTVE